VVRFNTPTHKQANLSLQIDKADMIFSQSVLSVVHADPILSPDSLTQWGENDNQTQEVSTLSNDTVDRQLNPEAQPTS
jgi:hypothetical protein